MRVFIAQKWHDLFAATLPNSTGLMCRNLELSVGNRKVECVEKTAVHFTFLCHVDYFGVELILKRRLCIYSIKLLNKQIIPSGQGGHLCLGNIWSFSAAWSDMELPSLEVVSGGKPESGKDNTLSHLLLAQEGSSSADYFLCYTRLILVMEWMEHWDTVPWINCISVVVRGSQIELVKLPQCSNFIEKDVSAYGSLGPN